MSQHTAKPGDPKHEMFAHVMQALQGKAAVRNVQTHEKGGAFELAQEVRGASKVNYERDVKLSNLMSYLGISDGGGVLLHSIGKSLLSAMHSVAPQFSKEVAAQAKQAFLSRSSLSGLRAFQDAAKQASGRRPATPQPPPLYSAQDPGRFRNPQASQGYARPSSPPPPYTAPNPNTFANPPGAQGDTPPPLPPRPNAPKPGRFATPTSAQGDTPPPVPPRPSAPNPAPSFAQPPKADNAAPPPRPPKEKEAAPGSGQSQPAGAARSRAQTASSTFANQPWAQQNPESTTPPPRPRRNSEPNPQPNFAQPPKAENAAPPPRPPKEKEAAGDQPRTAGAGERPGRPGASGGTERPRAQSAPPPRPPKVEQEKPHTESTAGAGKVEEAAPKESAAKPLYQHMGLPAGATTAQIKTTYRKRVLKDHPDKNPNDPGAQARFTQLDNAYKILSNVTNRDYYDKGWINDEGKKTLSGWKNIPPEWEAP